MTFTRGRGRGLPADPLGRVQRRAEHRAVELPPLDHAGDGREGPDASPAAASCCRSARSRWTSPARARSASSASRCPPGDFTVVAKLSAPGLNTRRRRRGQHLRPGRPEALPGRQQLDQGRAQPQRGRRPDRLGGDVLRARVREQQHAIARSAPARASAPATCRRGGCGSSAPARRSRPPTRSPIPTATGGANWVSLGTANIDTVMPAADGPRYIGVYGGNGSVNVLRGLRPLHAGLAQRRRGAGEHAHGRRPPTAPRAGTARR